MKVIYIAGPFRGPNAWEVEKNIRRAEELAFEVNSLGGSIALTRLRQLPLFQEERA